MKLEKRFKTVLGAIMAAVMVVTAVPVTGSTVQAAQTVQTEETTEETTESLHEETGQGSETQTEEQRQNDEEKNESQADEETTEVSETQNQSMTADEDESESQTESVSHNDENDSTDNNQTGHVVSGKEVTFTCVPTDGFFAYWDAAEKKNVGLEVANIERIIVRGGQSEWSQFATLTKGDNNVWTGNATLLPGNYSYKFFAYRLNDENGEHYEVGDNRNLVIDGIVDASVTAVRNVEFSLAPELDGYKNGEAAKVSVSYALSSESSQYSNHIEITGEVGSQKLTVKDTLDESVSSIVLTATDTVDSTNTGSVTVNIQTKVYEEDKDLKSPVIGQDKVTFYFFAPTAKNINIKGQMTDNWSEVPMEFNDETGYWSIDLQVPAVGIYEYGFSGDISGNWSTDPLNPPPAGQSNSRVIIPGLLDFTANVVIDKETDLPAETEYLNEDGTKEPRAVTYALSDEAKEYQDKIELNTETGSITISSDWPKEVTSIELVATDGSNNTATVTVKILSKVYEEDKDLKSPVVGKGEATFYYFAPTAEKVEIKGQMTGSSWPTVPMEFNDETGYWVIKLTIPVGTYQYGFEVDGVWSTDPLNPPEEGQTNSVVTITEASSEVSPIVEGNKVTFRYKDDSAEKVSVAGEMNSWTPNKDMMTKNDETGYWELVMEDMPAGRYEYKLVVGDTGWKNDPLNANLTNGNDPNNIFWVTGLANGNVDVTLDGKAASLPKTLKLFTIDESTGTGTDAEVDVTYALSEETAAKEYADAIVLTEKTETEAASVSIKDTFPADVKLFTLTATDSNGNTSTVTVNVVEKKFVYTIYYYDQEHNTTDSAALWLWDKGDSGISQEYAFETAEVLSDGNTWLKTTAEVSFTNIGMKCRTPGTWDEWQEGIDHVWSNTDLADAVTLYFIADDSKVYTELPEIVILADRYLVVEYTRSDAIADWQLYTWNSGYGGEVWVPFETVEGSTTKGIAKVRIKHGLSSLSYCISQTIDGDVWGKKDGNDYLCPVPLDQTVVKIQMEEGKGITYVYPYNTGYEIEPAEDTIHFYYRDDDSFLAGSEGGFASVGLEIAVKDKDGNLKKAEDGTVDNLGNVMTYDTEEQRYEYDMPDLEPGTYYYRYLLKENEESVGTYALDGFNDKKETIEGAEYSVCTYEYYDAALEASMQNDTMDYNDNNVLTVSLTAKDSDGKEVDASDIVSKATVDLRAVGGGVTEIDPELMQLSISVRDTTSVGTKTLPVTVYDKYNNEYTTEVNVNVTSRTNTSYVDDDFDWDEAVIYFTVTDRFFDGNPGNNNGNAAGSYDINPETGCSSYHGGDFAGLTQKLDYLEDLGVNTIWITPIVENQLVANSVDNPAVTKAWGYHGYWAKNFENLDAHLGTEAEFKALLDAAHARGIKIMVDVVLNHSGYGDDITNYFNNYPTDDGTLRMLRNNDEVVSGSDQKASLSGLPDFLTENAEVRELLVEWQSNWISKYDIDYYRVDTVKHVDETTWSAFKNALTQINPDFKMIGEYAGGGYATDAGMLRTGRMDSLLDFDYNDKALAFVTGDISGTESFLTARNAAIDNTSTLGAFLSSHDEDGFVYKLTDTTGKYNYNKTKEEAEALAKVAASLQLTTKGQVVIYYGEEIGLTGAENYPYNTNRYDFDWSQTDAGANNTTLTHYRKLLDIRNRYSKVLAKGTRKTIEADNSRGLDVFARSYSGTTLTVALNISNAPIEYTLTGQEANAYLYDYYNGMQYQANAGGEVTIKIPAAAEGGTVILAEKKLGNVGETVDSDTLANSFDIEPIVDQIYTGKNIVLSEEQLKVYDGSRKMKLGTDYTVSYKNNKNAGTATVTVKGKGNYSGKETKEFEILPKDLGDRDVDIEYNADMLLSNKVQKPVTKITYNGMKLGTKDYQVTYYPLDAATGERKAALTTAGVKEAGAYEVVLTGGKSKNYAGEVVMKVEVHEKGTLMSKMKITLSASKAECTGYPIKPGVTVKENKADVPSANYTVSYKNNVNIGTATVTITGKPSKGYYGSVVKTFKITGKSLSSVAMVDTAKWQSSIVYDFFKGRTEQPKDALTLLQKNSSSPAVTLGKDYTVAYSKNTAPGTATVSFTGKGMYTGTIKKTFKVTPIDFTAVPKEELTYTVQETAPYAKKGATAGVTVEYNGAILRQGVDYKLAYSNNKAVTTSTTSKKPTVKITGTGKFAGALPDQEFTIVKADLAQSDLSAADVVFQNKAGKFISIPVLDGAKIKAAEFTTEYWLVNYDDAGNETGTELKDNTYTASVNSTIRVKVTATEDNTKYQGEITKDYRVVNKSVSSASVKIQAKVYTGKEIRLTEEDFTKIKIGSDNLILGTDYVIIDSSYTNNVNKGTASVTIKGIGNYGGTKKVTFKITTRELASLENMFL